MEASKLIVTIVINSSNETELTDTPSLASSTMGTVPGATVKTDNPAADIDFATLQLGYSNSVPENYKTQL